MPNYAYCKNVEPRWLSKFLGHKWQTILVAAALFPTPLWSGNWRDIAFFPGALLGLLMSPDLDLSWSRLGWFGRLSLADEYTALVPHRAKISHTPVIGTVVRFSVVFGVILVFLIVPLVAIARSEGLGVGIPWWAVWRAFIGLSFADAWHVACDWIEGALKMKRH